MKDTDIARVLESLECPHCGNTDFEHGALVDDGEIGFKADDSSLFSGSDYVEAFACTNCGRIEFFT